METSAVSGAPVDVGECGGILRSPNIKAVSPLQTTGGRGTW